MQAEPSKSKHNSATKKQVPIALTHILCALSPDQACIITLSVRRKWALKGKRVTIGWLPGTGFDAYPWRHPVTESIYINSLANSPYRSTVKTLPATLPEPWTMVRGPRSKHIGPWFTDLEPRIVDSVSRLKLRGSRLVDAGPGYWE